MLHLHKLAKRTGARSLVHAHLARPLQSHLDIQRAEDLLIEVTEQDLIHGEQFSPTSRETPESEEGPWFQQPVSKPLKPCLTSLLNKTGRGKPQKSGSVFVCWLVCWWDWVYETNWLDWCVVG